MDGFEPANGSDYIYGVQNFANRTLANGESSISEERVTHIYFAPCYPSILLFIQPVNILELLKLVLYNSLVYDNHVSAEKDITVSSV